METSRIRENRTIRTRLTEETDAHSWDAFVLSQEEAGPYHLYAWRRAVESAYGHRAHYVMAQDDDGAVRGILPLILVKPPLLKAGLVSLPFCDYGGVLASDEDTCDALYRHARRLSDEGRAGLDLRLKAADPFLETAGLFDDSTHKVRMVLELPENPELLWDGFKSKLRSQIRKPQKDGLEFSLGSSELVDDFYGVFTVNMRDLGSPVHSMAWIEAVVRYYGTRAQVGVVRAGKKPVAAGIILEGNGIMAIPWASALREYSSSSPNMLLYWGFLAYACRQGCRKFDFGRSSPGEGTYRFKEQWGAVPHPLHWYGSGDAKAAGSGEAAGRLRPLIEKIWARMPQGLTDTIGPMVRRFITL